MTQQIVKNSAKFGEEVDWRLAFYELQDITEHAKLTVPVPSRLSIEGRLYNKMSAITQNNRLCEMFVK